MNINRFWVIPAKKAPTAAIPMLKAINFFVPYLSDINPAGIAINAVQRGGIAAIRPICWLERLNSSLITGKRVVRILPATWVKVWVMNMANKP